MEKVISSGTSSTALLLGLLLFILLGGEEVMVVFVKAFSSLMVVWMSLSSFAATARVLVAAVAFKVSCLVIALNVAAVSLGEDDTVSVVTESNRT